MEGERKSLGGRRAWHGAPAALLGLLAGAGALLGLCEWRGGLIAETPAPAHELPRGDLGGHRPEPDAGAPPRLLASERAAEESLTADEREEVARARRRDAAELRGELPRGPGGVRGAHQGGVAGAGGRDRGWVRSAAPHVERESVGSSEWVVVFDGGPINVRSAKDLSARVLGKREEGEVVFGRLEGEWLELAHERGYIKSFLKVPPTTLLRRRTTSYVQLSDGRCKDVDRFPIMDASACQAASSALGYRNATLEVSDDGGGDDDDPQPQGCHVLGGQVWLARGIANMGNGAVDGRKPICSSNVYPAAAPAL